MRGGVAGGGGGSLRMGRVASSPSMTGMRMSMRITSGRGGDGLLAIGRLAHHLDAAR